MGGVGARGRRPIHSPPSTTTTPPRSTTAPPRPARPPLTSQPSLPHSLGFNIITGGTVGEHAQLAATEFEKAVPADEVYGRLRELLLRDFGAVER